MRRTTKKCNARGHVRAVAILAAVGALWFSTSARGGVVIAVPVAQDVSINRANPLSNLNSITVGGGLLVGLDATGSDYSFYAKFDLPILASDEAVTNASLVGTYNVPIGKSLRPAIFARFVPDDSWDESTVTASNGPPAEGGVLAGLDTSALTAGREHRFSNLGLSRVVDQQAHADGVLSLKFDTIDGRFDDLQNFSSRESGMGGAFRLEMEVSKVKPIPLPPAIFSIFGMLPIGAAYLWRRGRVVTN